MVDQFLKFVRANYRVLQFLTIVLSAVSSLVALLSPFHLGALHLLSGLDAATLDEIINPLQTLTIVVLILSLAELPVMNESKEFANATTASHQFMRFWALFWALLFLFYVALTYQSFRGAVTYGPVKLAMDTLQWFSTGLLYLCYLVLVVRTVPVDRHWHTRIVKVATAVAGIVIVEAALFMSPILDGHPDLFKNLKTGFDAFEGLGSGIALALLVGRLESKFIDSPRWLIGTLYGYAVLQFGYVFIGGTSDPHLNYIEPIMLSIALPLKVLLFWHFQGLIRSGTLTYYLYEYRKLLSTSASERTEVLSRLLQPRAG